MEQKDVKGRCDGHLSAMGRAKSPSTFFCLESCSSFFSGTVNKTSLLLSPLLFFFSNLREFFGPEGKKTETGRKGGEKKTV